MQIIGFNEISKFEFCQEKSSVFGSYDYMKGKEEASSYKKLSFGMFGKSVKEAKAFYPQLHLHIPKNTWSKFTFYLRKYLLPFRWKAVYLYEKKKLTQILVHQKTPDCALTDKIKEIYNTPPMVANLIGKSAYKECFGNEFHLEKKDRRETYQISHPIGNWFGKEIISGKYEARHIYRVRGVFSGVKFFFLKKFSSNWNTNDFALTIGKTVIYREEFLYRKEPLTPCTEKIFPDHSV